MHPIDEAIMTGTFTLALLDEHVTLPLPAVGHSYWGDAMRTLVKLAGPTSPELAVLRAAREMGAALSSIGAVSR